MAGRDKYMTAFQSVRGLVVDRDDNKCVKCASNIRLEVHHVNGYIDNNIKNLQTLCYRCHGVAPMGSDYWTWLDSGLDGTHQLSNYVFASVRQSYSDKTNDEFEEMCETALKDIERSRIKKPRQ
mgnify:CR=1 FL=1